MAVARARRDAGMNYWPGFVDALSTLILGIIFLLTVFVVVQFYLTGVVLQQVLKAADTARRPWGLQGEALVLPKGSQPGRSRGPL